MNKSNILIISTFYPPINHIASNRIFSFAKYLDKSKYNVTILTLDDGTIPDNTFDLESVKVIRIKNISPYFRIKASGALSHKLKILFNYFLHLFYPVYSNWEHKAYKAAKGLISEKNIEVLISSYGPLEPHIISTKIKRKFPAIKWIADMRDEMSTNINISKFEKWKLRRAEARIFETADAITAVSEPILNYFESSNKNKCLYKEIKNGYDFEIDYRTNNNLTFCITYTGTFYRKIKPANFFSAVEYLINKRIIEDISIIIVGSYSNFIIPKSIKKYLTQYDRLPHETALKFMKQSDALLLIHPNDGRKGVYTGKLFEYLGMLRPIIALVDKTDVAAQLITNCRAGFIAENEDIPAISDIILKAYNNWKNKVCLDYNIELIKTLHRREQAKRLESLIDNLKK